MGDRLAFEYELQKQAIDTNHQPQLIGKDTSPTWECLGNGAEGRLFGAFVRLDCSGCIELHGPKNKTCNNAHVVIVQQLAH